jgi:putative serine protease PepD
MYSSSRSRLRGLVLPAAALAAVVAGATACGSSSGSTTGSSSSSGNSSSELQDQYVQVVRDVLPSVVQITTNDSTGSGVVYDDHGNIVTNEHVLGDAKSVEVRDAAGNRVFTAKVIGEFAPDDLAVIRVTQDASKLKAAKFADSSETQIGEIVLAMGNPLGLTDSVTQGIISATGRTVGASEDGGQALITAAIQTSAAINPGNSGGALVNLQDEVVGIPTLAARLPDQGGAAPGIGFAIPSDTVQNIANQLIKTGHVTNSDRASLGIVAQTSANQQGEAVGVAVVDVAKGGTAATAGLRPGDVIIALNGARIDSLQQLEALVNTLKPGTKVTITYTRNGSQRSGSAKLGSLGS